MENGTYLIVNTKVLPPVYSKVVQAKQILAEGIAPNTSKAVQMVGISRSAFYKYKDCVFKYNENKENTITLTALLSDKAGVFSGLASLLYELGANIITVNQSSPIDGMAKVTLTASTDNVTVSLKELLDKIKSVKGIIGIKAE